MSLMVKEDFCSFTFVGEKRRAKYTCAINVTNSQSASCFMYAIIEEQVVSEALGLRLEINAGIYWGREPVVLPLIAIRRKTTDLHDKSLSQACPKLPLVTTWRIQLILVCEDIVQLLVFTS